MTMQLENRHLSFRLDESGWWSLAAPRDGSTVLTAHAEALWRCRNRPLAWDGGLPRDTELRYDRIDTPAGAGPGIRAEFATPLCSAHLALEWVLPADSPGLLWRMSLRGEEELRLDRLHGLCAGGRPRIAFSSGPAHGLYGMAKPAAFITGWQSFGFAGTLGPHDVYPRTRLGPLLRPSREHPGTRPPRTPGKFLAEMFAIVGDRDRRLGLLLGSVSARQAFTSFEIDITGQPVRVRAWCHGDDALLPAGETFTTDWAYAEFVDVDSDDPLGSYLELAARAAEVSPETPDRGGLSGWCSWYRLYRRIDEDAIRANLEWLGGRRDRLPVDVFQVDDGYEQKVGDWHPPWRGFSSSPKALAESIRQRGFKAGLWLAPFVVEAASRTAREHPDWVLRRGDGRPVSIGLLGSNLPYALDATHPGVLDHLAALIETAVSEWGFELLKLDFLYAAALQGNRHDPRLTRAQAFRAALSRLRESAGGAWITGCGCPLGPAIGLVDSMRISPDVAPSWYPHYRGVHAILRAEATAPGARNSLRNAIQLAPLHRRWWINDPDCVLLQPEASGWADAAPRPLGLTDPAARRWDIPRKLRRLGLAVHEVQTLVTVDSLTGGAIIDSDHLPELETTREAWLAALLPPLNGRARAADWFDAAYPSCLVLPVDDASGRRWLVALVNWSERPASVQIRLERLGIPSAASYDAVSFWDGSYSRLGSDILVSPRLPPHGVHLVCLRPYANLPAWLGDTFHISMGSAVRRFGHDGSAVHVDLELPRRASGMAWLSLPEAPVWARTEAGSVGFEHAADHVARIPLTWSRSAHLEIGWAEPSSVSEPERGWGAADSS